LNRKNTGYHEKQGDFEIHRPDAVGYPDSNWNHARCDIVHDVRTLLHEKTTQECDKKLKMTKKFGS